MRTLHCCRALTFLALAGLEAKANRDFCIARPTAYDSGLGQNRQILGRVHRGNGPWMKQPLYLSLQAQEMMSLGFLGVELLQPSKAGRFFVETASQEHSNSGTASSGEAVPPGVPADLAGVSLPKVGRPHNDASLQRREIAQRRGKQSPIVLFSMEIVRS